MPRSERLELRVTSAEKAVWDSAAVQAGVGISELVRRLVNQALAVPKQSHPVQPIPVPEPVPVPAHPPPPQPAPPKSPYNLCWQCTPTGKPTCAVCRFLAGIPA